MENVKTVALLCIAILILSSFAVLASCTLAAPVIETTAVVSITTMPPATTTAPPATTTAPPATTTEAAPTTTVVTTATLKQKDVYIPVVGTEFPTFNREQDKWITLQFEYNAVQEPMNDWQFLWSLTIKNKTENDLELTAYIVYVGYHEWVGYVTNTPFVLKGGETKTLSGVDMLTDGLVEQIAYIREANLVSYIVER